MEHVHNAGMVVRVRAGTSSWAALCDILVLEKVWFGRTDGVFKCVVEMSLGGGGRWS